ncbi:MAG: Na/Pi cotransporter family protein [Clostridia bacterium]|nr:Na/Pi cotransporter family protein [Clostridia bacterium]
MILPLIGGLCLFLFGMNTMGESLERRAGSALRTLLGKLTTNKFAGFLTGLGVTAVIQSSSATTVMVVGFVNSGLMTLKQAINVIMGANVGTTVTAWILSMAGIEGSAWLNLLKPTSFTPVLAVIGIVMCMFLKDEKKKDTGTILLGFATLMFGMDMMSDAMKPLGEMQWFQEMFTMFENPILGLLAGAILTAIIQSSSASVGILQALAGSTGVSYGAAIPIIMGQNIGTCITAILSSAGTTKNAKRAAFVHLSFNVIGAVSLLTVFTIVKTVFASALMPLLETNASEFGIAVAHSAFNILCVIILLPMSSLLEKLAIKLIPDAKAPETVSELDERLLDIPSLALERCHTLVTQMAQTATDAFNDALECLQNYTPEAAEKIRAAEDLTDHYEDILGTYLVKLTSRQTGQSYSVEATELLKMIGDFERIADHAVNILESAEEMNEKKLEFSKPAQDELAVMNGAVREIVTLSMTSFYEKDLTVAAKVEPLEELIDILREELRTRHIMRLTQNNCSIEAGFVWSDLLTNLERVSDHCSNIAGCIIDSAHNNMNLHESQRTQHGEQFYAEQLAAYKEQYRLS